MNDSKKVNRIIALILVVVMSFSIFASCTPNTNGDNAGNNEQSEQENNNGNSDIGGGGTNNEPGDNTNKAPDDDIHTCAFGEWVIVKAPTNTEDGLQERKCSCGKVEQQVIKASGGEFAIYYNNLKTAEYPDQTGYNSDEGLLALPKPVAEGYTFVGWFTSSIGGDIVDYIPKGSTNDYVLFAHWELVNYSITYKNVPNNTNPTTYNIESKLKLETPKWSGLEFDYWTDEDGNKYIPNINITSLPANMSGDLILTANWKVRRNLVTNSVNPEFNVGYSTDDGYLFFYYKLGTIQHVVLDSKSDINHGLYYKSEGIEINYTLSNTVTVSEETAETISNTISTSVSKSTTISESENWAENESANWNNELGGSFGFDYEIDCGFAGNHITAGMSMEINGKTGKGGTEGSSSGWEKSNSTTNSSSTETSESVSSSLSFMKEISTTKEETIFIGADQPSGYYVFAHAGDIEVYAVVIYDKNTCALYMNTYSYLDNMHSMVMYYPDVESMNNPSIDTLDFTIPKEKIVNIIENSYYVEYDANGGEGTMPTTIHSVGGNEQLAKCEFTKAGSIFAGWQLETDNGVEILLDGQSVTDIGNALETVTLKALWTTVGPVWEEKESGTNFYIKPNDKMRFDQTHELTLKYNNTKLESSEDEKTKIVVTEEKFYTYVYWHWAYRTDKIYDYFIGEYQGEKLQNGKTAQYYRAFESTESYGHKDSTGTVDNTCYYHNTGKASDGSWWWFRFEVVVQTYTVYENVNYKE